MGIGMAWADIWLERDRRQNVESDKSHKGECDADCDQVDVDAAGAGARVQGGHFDSFVQFQCEGEGKRKTHGSRCVLIRGLEVLV